MVKPISINWENKFFAPKNEITGIFTYNGEKYRVHVSYPKKLDKNFQKSLKDNIGKIEANKLAKLSGYTFEKTLAEGAETKVYTKIKGEPGLCKLDKDTSKEKEQATFTLVDEISKKVFTGEVIAKKDKTGEVKLRVDSETVRLITKIKDRAFGAMKRSANSLGSWSWEIISDSAEWTYDNVLVKIGKKLKDFGNYLLMRVEMWLDDDYQQQVKDKKELEKRFKALNNAEVPKIIFSETSTFEECRDQLLELSEFVKKFASLKEDINKWQEKAEYDDIFFKNDEEKKAFEEKIDGINKKFVNRFGKKKENCKNLLQSYFTFLQMKITNLDKKDDQLFDDFKKIIEFVKAKKDKFDMDESEITEVEKVALELKEKIYKKLDLRERVEKVPENLKIPKVAIKKDSSFADCRKKLLKLQKFEQDLEKYQSLCNDIADWQSEYDNELLYQEDDKRNDVASKIISLQEQFNDQLVKKKTDITTLYESYFASLTDKIETLTDRDDQLFKDALNIVAFLEKRKETLKIEKTDIEMVKSYITKKKEDIDKKLKDKKSLIDRFKEIKKEIRKLNVTKIDLTEATSFSEKMKLLIKLHNLNKKLQKKYLPLSNEILGWERKYGEDLFASDDSDKKIKDILLNLDVIFKSLLENSKDEIKTFIGTYIESLKETADTQKKFDETLFVDSLKIFDFFISRLETLGLKKKDLNTKKAEIEKLKGVYKRKKKLLERVKKVPKELDKPKISETKDLAPEKCRIELLNIIEFYNKMAEFKKLKEDIKAWEESSGEEFPDRETVFENLDKIVLSEENLTKEKLENKKAIDRVFKSYLELIREEVFKSHKSSEKLLENIFKTLECVFENCNILGMEEGKLRAVYDRFKGQENIVKRGNGYRKKVKASHKKSKEVDLSTIKFKKDMSFTECRELFLKLDGFDKDLADGRRLRAEIRSWETDRLKELIAEKTSGDSEKVRELKEEVSQIIKETDISSDYSSDFDKLVMKLKKKGDAEIVRARVISEDDSEYSKYSEFTKKLKAFADNLSENKGNILKMYQSYFVSFEGEAHKLKKFDSKLFDDSLKILEFIEEKKKQLGLEEEDFDKKKARILQLRSEVEKKIKFRERIEKVGEGKIPEEIKISDIDLSSDEKEDECKKKLLAFAGFFAPMAEFYSIADMIEKGRDLDNVPEGLKRKLREFKAAFDGSLEGSKDNILNLFAIYDAGIGKMDTDAFKDYCKILEFMLVLGEKLGVKAEDLEKMKYVLENNSILKNNLTHKPRVAKTSSSPVGLQNPGNNCYLNSSCQAIMPLLESLKSKDESRLSDSEKIIRAKFLAYYDNYKKVSEMAQDFLVGKAYNNMLARMYHIARDRNVEILANSLRDTVHEIGKLPDRNTSQQDASDFLTPVMNGLGYHIMQEENRVFKGKNITASERNPMEVVRLEIAGKKSLKDCIEGLISTSYDEPFTIEGDEKTYPNHVLETRLAEIPEVLVIQLGRFKETGRFNSSGEPKIDKLFDKIDIPDEIDLKDLIDSAVVETGESTKYRPVSYVFHRGETLKSGHYIADVRIGGDWYHCNDSIITKGKREKNGQPYILVLERITD